MALFVTKFSKIFLGEGMIVQVGIYSKVQLLIYEREHNTNILKKEHKISGNRFHIHLTANDTDTPQTGDDKENRVKIRDAR